MLPLKQIFALPS